MASSDPWVLARGRRRGRSVQVLLVVQHGKGKPVLVAAPLLKSSKKP